MFDVIFFFSGSPGCRFLSELRRSMFNVRCSTLSFSSPPLRVARATPPQRPSASASWPVPSPPLSRRRRR
jgi:hypothetical protein